MKKTRYPLICLMILALTLSGCGGQGRSLSPAPYTDIRSLNGAVDFELLVPASMPEGYELESIYTVEQGFVCLRYTSQQEGWLTFMAGKGRADLMPPEGAKRQKVQVGDTLVTFYREDTGEQAGYAQWHQGGNTYAFDWITPELLELILPTLAPSAEQAAQSTLWQTPVAYDSAEAVAEKVGREFVLPEDPAGYTPTAYFTYSDLVMGADFTQTGRSMRYAKAPAVNPFPANTAQGSWTEEQSLPASGVRVTLCFQPIGSDDLPMVVSVDWATPDGDNCRLSFDPGEQREVAIAAAEAFTAHLEPIKADPSQILGSEILLDLPEDPASGSEWAYRLEPADVLLVTEDVYLGDEGQSGARHLRLRAQKAGEVVLTLKSMPPQPDDEAFAAFEEGLIITYRVDENLSVTSLGAKG